MDGWKDEWVDDGWMDGWVGGWMDGCIGGWVGGESILCCLFIWLFCVLVEAHRILVAACGI